MKKTLSKREAEKHVEEFFSKVKHKNPKEIKKIKKFAMAYSIKLGKKRKTFCKSCLNPFKEPSIRIKNDIITVTCENCGYKSKWKVSEDPIIPIDNEENECGC